MLHIRPLSRDEQFSFTQHLLIVENITFQIILKYKMYCVFLKLQACFKETNIIGVTINIVALNKISDLAATVALNPLRDETTFSLELAFSSG